MPEEPVSPSPTPTPAKKGYDLDPEPVPPPRPALPSDPLLSGFDEDADFDKDPEVARALSLKPTIKAATPDSEPEKPREDLVRAGRGEPQIIAGIGGVLALIAVGISAAAHPDFLFRAALATLLLTILNIAMGIAALSVSAHLQGLAMTRWALGASRMVLAVAAFQLVNAITLPTLGVWGRFILVPAAAAAYLLTLIGLFRFPRHRLFVVASCHGLLSLAAWLMFALYAWALDHPPPATPTPTP